MEHLLTMFNQVSWSSGPGPAIGQPSQVIGGPTRPGIRDPVMGPGLANHREIMDPGPTDQK